MWKHGEVKVRKQKSGLHTASVEIWDDEKDTCNIRSIMPITGYSEANVKERTEEYIADLNKNRDTREYEERVRKQAKEDAASKRVEPAVAPGEKDKISVQTSLFGLQV